MAGDAPKTFDVKPLLKVLAWAFLTLLFSMVSSCAAAISVCVVSEKLNLRLADFTCGHNVPYPAMLFFLIFAPIIAVSLPKLIRRLR
jgi:hypothetical protein